MNTIDYNNTLVTPSKVICVGRNYVEHIQELNNEMPNNMVLFNKPNSAISNKLYYINENIRYEGEICFLIQQNKIIAIGFGLDLTDAKIQNQLKQKSLPWERAKAFDNSAVFSSFVPFDMKDIQNIKMELYINDILTQKATYDLMIYKPQEILDEIGSFMKLEDNDIIMSGTPKGVGYYKIDDIFVGKIYIDDKLILQQQFQAKALI